MLTAAATRRMVPALLLLLATSASPLFAQSADDKFHKAYYLEQEKGDLLAAAELYGEVAQDRDADREIRAQARSRLASCLEELASADFARLMPAETLVYAELNKPGQQVGKLFEQLGLLGSSGGIGEGSQRIAISPALISGVLGLRGVAVAVTGFDMEKGEPDVVGILHPGDLGVVRGLIETAVPAGGEAVEPIGGFPTYNIEGEAFVTLTQRLVIVSNRRALIEGVVGRLRSTRGPSLATSDAFDEVLKDRDDSLLFFCVNAKALMPMAMKMAEAETGAQELAMIRAILDPESLQWISGRVGMSDDGLGLDVAVRLSDNHRNLVFNLLRMPGVSEDTLKAIPEGAAGFMVAALNESAPRDDRQAAEGAPVVTAWDFGRELFGNIVSIGVYALPPEEGAAGRSPIPDVAAVFTVNDPAKSEALWTQILGIANLASGGRSIEGETTTIGGESVKSFKIPDGPSIYCATVGNELIVSPSPSAIERSIRARRSGRSILNDAKFASSLARLSPSTSKAIFIHPGRCFQIAKTYMSSGEVAELAPFLDRLDDTVVSFVVNHSDNSLEISALVAGIPKIGDLVSQMVAAELGGGSQRSRARILEQQPAPVAAATSFDSNEAALQAKFVELAVEKKDRQAAMVVGEAMLQNAKNPTSVNNFAWALLTEEQFGGQYTDIALKLSQRSNEMTEFKNWAYLDTLALATYETGDVAAAIELQKKAIEQAGEQPSEEIKAALARYQSAVARGKVDKK